MKIVYLNKFWENDEPAENIFPRHLDPKRINAEQYPHIFKSKYGYKLKPEALDDFREEVIKLQTPPTDKWGLGLWQSVTSPKAFKCIVKDDV